jgi:molybdopterin synthase sulfur carrier subunit
MATVKLFGGLRNLGAAPVNDVEGQTVRAVILALCAENTALKEAIFDGDVLRPHVRVMIDGRDIELAEGLETPLTGNEQVAIFPPIAGGDNEST